MPCGFQGRQEWVQVPVKKKKKFRPSNKGEAAKNLYTKSERPTLTRRVT